MMRGSNGHDFNVYLTRDKLSMVQGEEDEEEEVVRTEFFAIKLVEAGGLMKGEKWHVVNQQVYMCECECCRRLLFECVCHCGMSSFGRQNFSKASMKRLNSLSIPGR